MKGFLIIVWLAFVISLTGCANYPVESETYRYPKITIGDFENNGDCVVTFHYVGGAKHSLLANRTQWLRIKHIRNQDWEHRKDIYYVVNYRNNRLLSFYKQE